MFTNLLQALLLYYNFLFANCYDKNRRCYFNWRKCIVFRIYEITTKLSKKELWRKRSPCRRLNHIKGKNTAGILFFVWDLILLPLPM